MQSSMEEAETDREGVDSQRIELDVLAFRGTIPPTRPLRTAMRLACASAERPVSLTPGPPGVPGSTFPDQGEVPSGTE